MSQLDRTAYLRLVRGQTKGPVSRLARAGLRLASLAYGMGVAVRNAGFDRGWNRIHQATIPVVSIGNITLGGTGKTPTVEWVARWYRQRSVRVAILSRGYGQAGTMNDEGRVLEENLPDVPHLQDPDRVALATIASQELESQLLVLDDGFQHRRLGRDVDIVLLDALEPFGLNYLFPRGLLREPIRTLRRADLVILSRADLVTAERRTQIRQEAEKHAGPLPWVEARHTPIDLIDSEGISSPLDLITGQSIAAFCGIGNPDGFRRTIEPLCGKLLGLSVFPDHHAYSATDVANLEQWATNLGADLVLTTQKDLVKLRAGLLGPAPLRALRIGLELTAGGDVMDGILARLLPGFRRDED